MRAKVNAVSETRMIFAQALHGAIAAAGEFVLCPDLVKPARIAAIALNEVLGTHAQPARNPDVNGIIGAETAIGAFDARPG